MSFLVDQFRQYFLGLGLKESSCNSYLVNLRKIDSALVGLDRTGLDETVSGDLDWLVKWASTTIEEPFDKETSNRRAALKKYLMFRESLGDIDAEIVEQSKVDEIPLEPSGQAFHLERDMQNAVRRQIESLEVGLRIVDKGFERRVPTGEIDITAIDKNGNFVTIELKAGDCPKGALEQLLGYANDIKIEEEVEIVRMFLIAKSFSDRLIGAASFVPNLQLVTYDYTLQFNQLSGLKI